MATCLVTTLKESAQDESLLKLGEIAFVIESKNATVPIRIDGNLGELRIIGDGYFTNEAGTANYGKTATHIPNTPTYASFGTDYLIVADNKYSMTWLRMNGVGSYKNNLKDFQYCTALYNIEGTFTDFTGSINDLPPTMTYIALSKLSLSADAQRPVTGNVSSFASNATTLSFENCRGIEGNLSSFASSTKLINFLVGNSSVKGSLASLSNVTTLKKLHLQGTAVTGNLSSLSGLTDLTDLKVDNTAITGDTSALRNLTKLTTFTYTNTAITGTWPLT